MNAVLSYCLLRLNKATAINGINSTALSATADDAFSLPPIEHPPPLLPDGDGDAPVPVRETVTVGEAVSLDGMDIAALFEPADAGENFA